MAEKLLESSVRKRIAKRREKRKQKGDTHEEPRSLENCRRAYGFDLDYSSDTPKLVKSTWGKEYHIALFARLGLHCHNFHKGTNFKFNRWEKFSTDLTSCVNFYITLEATDPACGSVVSLQTLFSDVGRREGIRLSWMTLASRIKCNDPLNDEWDEATASIDEWYKSAMPKWFSDEALAREDKKYYVVQEAELHENDWLHLLMEIAFFAKLERNSAASHPLEIKNVVIQTVEEYTTEAREKLKAKNAVFYISYKCNADSSKAGWAGDHKAIIRKTMDGRPGHMFLEVATTKEQQEVDDKEDYRRRTVHGSLVL